MKIPLKSLGLIGCFAALGGCRTEPPNTFKFTADLPPGFAYVAAVYYVPEKGQTCTLDRRDNLAPVFNSKWRTDYKPDAEITIRKTVKGCPLVVRRIELEINSAYGRNWSDFSRDEARVFIRDDLEEQFKGVFNEAGESTFHGQCEWWFRTSGKPRILRKILDCRTVDASGSRAYGKTFGAFSPDQLPGKTVRMKITLAAEERPAIKDTWVKVPNGWKRCMGDNFEDQYAFCYGNYTDFSGFQMPDGQQCTIYPGCTEKKVSP
ncbi:MULTISPECIES: hypothetical protein [unclassified Pseudomonas]|uniref:hypothetical protein n=1 Tax=unclassified Pseudomonas TaxID=196821 RepID=UPI000A1F1D67|nr:MULTISPECIES: hypothetical protein [unclassified Pseudomonas]MDI2144440.1 hypothetical protein [Pseudomonas sp. ITA]